MGFRFQRRIGILPGVRLNFSKSGVSASVGVRGAHLTIGRTPRVTVGLPGSGLSYTETLKGTSNEAPTVPSAPSAPRPGWQVALIVVAAIVVLLIIWSGGR